MTIRIAADMHAPRAARTYVVAQIQQATFDLSVEDVVLVTSELVSNAVRAEASEVVVTLRVLGESVDLIVEDDAPGMPTPRVAGPGDPGGRGLKIVDTLATSWEVAPLPVGKRVTATWRAASG